MNGIERSENWFFSTLLPALQHDFAGELPVIAAGIAGRGSECFGFDDEVSQDHDWGTGVSFWLTQEDERAFGFKLERFYNRLYREKFPASSARSAMGRIEHGVMTVEDFYRRHIGIPGKPESWEEWFYTPEYAFAEAVNGRVFCDGRGIFTAIRHEIINGMPEDVRRKKLAARAALMAQSGQYNFNRCLMHHEPAAAAMALSEFVQNTVVLIFLLNRRFAPYYKWMFRAMAALPILGEVQFSLTRLLTEKLNDSDKSVIIEEISAAVADEFRRQQLSSHPGNYLEPHAMEIQASIRLRQLREMHLMAC